MGSDTVTSFFLILGSPGLEIENSDMLQAVQYHFMKFQMHRFDNKGANILIF